MSSQNDKPGAKRILLVDDHPVVRDGLGVSINLEPDLFVCAVAEDRPEAMTAIETAKPDLAVVDLTLKTSSGFELIKDITARWPSLPTLVVSMHDESLYAERALRAGAKGYITKQQATRDIVTAIRRVLSGNIYLNERTASSVISKLAAHPQAIGDSITDGLTDRELQVFELTGLGLSTRDIAERLRIDTKTVDTYRTRIKDKLRLKNSHEILQLAIRWNQGRGQAADAGNAPGAADGRAKSH